MENKFGRRKAFGSIAAMTTVAGITMGAQGARAQEATPTTVPFETVSTVSVTGTGRIIVEPDTASISLGVTVFESNLAEAQARATTEMTAIIDAVKAAGIAEEDIQTSNYSVSIRQEYDQSGNPSKVIGYDINNTVTVTVRDLDALGGILDSVVAAGANTIYGISFYTWDLTDATAQARVAAVGDAKTHADQLAGAAGMTVGRILSISEGYSAPPVPMYYERAAMDMAQGAGSAVPVQVGTQQVEVQVNVVYELQA